MLKKAASLRSQNPDEAEKLYLEAVVRYPKNLDCQEAYGVFLLQRGSPRKALPSLAKAVELARKANDKDSLAPRLNDLGIAQDRCRQFREAEMSYTEALKLYKELLARNPALYRVHYARCLNNRGLMRQRVANTAGAREDLKNALTIREEFAGSRDNERMADYAATLNNLAITLDMAGERAEARQTLAKAVSQYRELQRSDAKQYGHFLASALTDLGNLLKRAGEPKGAQDAHGEAVEIYDRLEVGNPTFPYRDDFDRTLNDYAVFLDGTDDPKLIQLSLGAYVRATNLYSSLTKTNPMEYEPRLAKALNNLGTLQRKLAPAAAARTTLQQALAVYGRLARDDPATYRETLASAWSDFAYFLSEGTNILATREAYEEALGQYRELARSKAWTNRSGYALTLNNYAVLLDAVPDTPRAQKAYDDALEICRAGGYYADMVLVLNNVAGLLQKARDYAKARDRYQQALKACDQLREREPAAFGVNLAKTRLGLASLELSEAAVRGEAGHLKAAESELAKAREALKPLPRSPQVNKLVQRDRDLSADLAFRQANR